MGLKEYLKENKISNRTICNKAEIAESTLSQFINKERDLKFKTACKISDALKLTLDEFRAIIKEG